MLDSLRKSDAIILDWALAIAALLALLHVAAPQLRTILRPHAKTVGSLGGGMAVTHVFLNLFPELEVGEAIFGKRIHLLVLVGFLLYYGVEHSLGLRESQHGVEMTKRGRFILDLSLKWIYGWLLICALPESLKLEGFAMIPLLLAVGLHQAHDDFGLSEAFERDFDVWGRYVLASGPLIGWLTDLLFFKNDPLVSSVCTAVLAGSCLYIPRTARKETFDCLTPTPSAWASTPMA